MSAGAGRGGERIEGSGLGKAADVAIKGAVGCWSCVTLACAAAGGLLGSSLGAAYHAFFADEGSLLFHIGLGLSLGAVAGARVVFPLEELLFGWVEDRLDGLSRSTPEPVRAKAPTLLPEAPRRRSVARPALPEPRAEAEGSAAAPRRQPIDQALAARAEAADAERPRYE